MSPADSPSKGGLEGIVAGASALCDINGVTGRLLYAGYDIVDLAAHSSFEETAYLLWHGELPTQQQLAALTDQLRQDAEPPSAVWHVAETALARTDPMDVLRTQVSLLGMLDDETTDNSDAADRRKSARLLAQMGTLVSGSVRIREGNQRVSPRPDLGIAGNFLYMLRGEEASPSEVHAFDVCLVLHAEHGMAASTFAARVTAATLADLHGAITSAIGTLKGPLHGGANEAALDLLHELLSLPNPAQRIRDMLANKQRIPGFGHRVYRTEDPRATILRRISEQLGELAGDTRWYELTRQIEAVVLEEKGLYPNVDLYSASVYQSLGIPRLLFTPIFAVSRVAGWTANILEQRRDNRLIRPDADYVGPPPREYQPMEPRRS